MEVTLSKISQAVNSKITLFAKLLKQIVKFFFNLPFYYDYRKVVKLLRKTTYRQLTLQMSFYEYDFK